MSDSCAFTTTIENARIEFLANEYGNAGRRAAPPNKAASATQTGGARRDRTDDLLLAKQALSQLSYGPVR
jgi:hypothetical protein